MIYILFGLAGAGKNYVGNILKDKFECHFWDADEALPEEMKKCISEKKPFTQDMRDKFSNIIVSNIQQLKIKHHDRPLIIAQALYKERNRLQISHQIPGVIFVKIDADTSVIQQRLVKRDYGIDKDYAKKISVNFEEPKLPHVVIVNNFNNDNDNDHRLMKQLRNLLNNSCVKSKKLSITNNQSFYNKDQSSTCYNESIPITLNMNKK